MQATICKPNTHNFVSILCVGRWWTLGKLTFTSMTRFARTPAEVPSLTSWSAVPGHQCQGSKAWYRLPPPLTVGHRWTGVDLLPGIVALLSTRSPYFLNAKILSAHLLSSSSHFTWIEPSCLCEDQRSLSRSSNGGIGQPYGFACSSFDFYLLSRPVHGQLWYGWCLEYMFVSGGNPYFKIGP